MAAILEGIRVLELGQVLAGPFAGAILSALGAEVIKVERVEGGDDARRMGPPFRGSDALVFQIFNAGKRSLALDLRSESGHGQLMALLADVDVLVHNLRPGVPEALGLDAGSLCARFPRLIHAGISAFGHVGPMALQPGYEPLVQAFSGLSSTNGGPDDPPMRAGASLCDQGSGMWVVIGVLALLERRHRTGRGGVVQASLLETALSWNAQKADAFTNEGRLPERHRSGHPGFVPYEAFETADRPLLICCGNDRLFGKLAQVLGRPDWVSDPRFATNRARLAHKAALLEQMAPLLERATCDDWTARLTAAGVPCAPVHTVPQALAHPQVRALGLAAPVPGTDFSLTGLPLTLDGTRVHYRGPAPALGEFGDAAPRPGAASGA